MGAAAVFVLTLVGYLVLTAVPALALDSDCTATNIAGNDDHIVINIATDYTFALAVAGDDSFFPSGNYVAHENNDTWEDLDDECDGDNFDSAGEDWIEVHGSNAGEETFIVVQPTGSGDAFIDTTWSMTWHNFTVDLGSGADTLGIEMGPYEFPFPLIGTLELPDPELEDCVALLTADGPGQIFPGSAQVVDFNGCFDQFNGAEASVDGPAAWGHTSGDMVVINAESTYVNTGDEDDVVAASDYNIEYDLGPDNTTDADDIPDADGIFDGDVEPDEGNPNGDGACDGDPSNLAVTYNGGTEDDQFESGFANDTFNGGPGDDEVDYDGDSVNFPTAPFCDGPGSVTVDLDTSTAPPAPPAVTGGSTGAYGIDVLVDVQDVEGTPHDDTLYGNNLDNDIRGDFGDDVIDGAGGDDAGGGENDDAGIDEGLEGDGEDSDSENCSLGADDQECHGDDTITGGDGDDEINGDGGDDELWGDRVDGGNGADEVEGDCGSDIVHEGPVNSGPDDLDGGPEDENDCPGESSSDHQIGPGGYEFGADVLDYSQRTTPTAVIAGGGACSGENNNAATETQPNVEACDSGDEQDVLGPDSDFEGYVTGSANDTLVGGGSGPFSGSESFQGNGGDDFIDGALVSGLDFGDDWAVYESDFGSCAAGIVADMNAGTVTGCSVDTIVQVEGIVGTNSNDTFIDDQGENNGYVGNDGDDEFDQGAGSSGDADQLQGDDGTDHLNYSARTDDIEGDMDGDGPGCGGFPVTCDYNDPDDDFSDGDEHGGEGDNWTSSTENITTGSGNDDITANDSENAIVLNDGNDEAWGDDGNDSFDEPAGSSFGDDEYNGEDGNDSFFSSEPAAAAAAVSQGDGADIVFGGNGFDWYEAAGRTTSQNLTIERGDDDDGTILCFQDDGVFGEGDGLCALEAILGGSGGDFIGGNNANNVLKGGPGDDNIQGLKGRDLTQGMAGDDRLSGGKGPDQLQGGPGHDVGNGGKGRDFCNASVEVQRSC